MFHFFCFISSCELAQAEEIKKERNDDDTQRDGGAERGGASASKRTDEIQTRDNFLTLLPVGYAANRFATTLSTPSPLKPPTLR